MVNTGVAQSNATSLWDTSLGAKYLSAGLVGIAFAISSGSALSVDSVEMQALFKDKAVVLIDGKQRVLTRGVVSPEGVTLISSTSSKAMLEIDGVRKEYELGNRVRAGQEWQSATFAPRVALAPTQQGHYITSGSINGFTVQFIVDTGATLVSMNSATASRIGIDYRIKGKKGYSMTAAGRIQSWAVNLDRVRVGEIELRNVRGSVNEKGPAQILLGMSFLKQLHMEQDGKLLMLIKKPY
ncbi:MAG: retropepsin-like aspartic protease family protein [Candidatus Eutrophobiaceae bacterium]